MFSILQADMARHGADVRELFSEYLQWGNAMLQQEYAISLDVGAMIEDDMQATGKFAPPDGCLLLGLVEGHVVGCACMRRIGVDMGEIKRMYVRPAYRGLGIGRALVSGVLDRARLAGYACLRLDSVRFMKEAHALYRSAGFRDVEPYPESEIPEDLRRHWVFMELAFR